MKQIRVPDKFEGDMRQSAREMKNNEAEHAKGVVAVIDILQEMELQNMAQRADNFKYDFLTTIPKTAGAIYFKK